MRTPPAGRLRRVDERDDRLHDLLASRRLTVQLDLRLERRARLHADRLNQRLATDGDTDPYQLDDDHDLAQILMLLAETALDHDEHTSGLSSDPVTGHLISRELANERARRRSE